MNDINIDKLKLRIKELEEENSKLKAYLDEAGIKYDFIEKEVFEDNIEITDDLARKFYSYFWGRTDVYAKRYVSKTTGKAGYYPQCENSFRYNVCPKRDNVKFDCSICPRRKWQKLKPDIIVRHLKGEKEDCSDVIGIYPLFPDDTCRFIVFDFDYHEKDELVEINNSYVDEVNAVRQICLNNNISCLVERSRSGSGAHLWIFFNENIDASLARTFGLALLDKGAETVNLKSFNFYDRMLPLQDSVGEGKLGNLIALPLQGQAIKKANSCFVDENFKAYKNQFEVLFNTKKLSKFEISNFIDSWKEEKLKLYPDLNTEKPWDFNNKFRKEDVKGTFEITLANFIYIKKGNLNPAIQNNLRRMAAIHNPEYYKHLAMKLSNYNTTRFIYEGFDDDNYIGIPRGLLDELVRKLAEAKIEYNIVDKREVGKKINVSFNGVLREEQEKAVSKMISYDTGILSAATAFGKTVVAANIIARKQTSTLILLESSSLVEQWVKALENFLVIDEELPEYTTKGGSVRKRKSLIGKIQSAHDSSTGIIDIAMVGSLCKKGEYHERLKTYGLVIVDECHHSASDTISGVLKEVNAKTVYGVTATPFRGDGLQKINEMLLGEVRFTYTAKERAMAQNIKHYVYPRFTRAINPYSDKISINDAYNLIRDNLSRDELIVDDVIKVIEEKRTPVILTKYKDHAMKLYKSLEREADRVFLLTGDLSKKERDSITKEMNEVSKDESMILIATGQLVGEGFDFPRLDTLFIAMPVAWKGLVEQYAGRLNRDYDGKESAIIYDYVDYHIRVFDTMYAKRMKAYSKIGYEIYSKTNNIKEANAIFRFDNYLETYNDDLASANKSIIVSSPLLSRDKVRDFIDLTRLVSASGVRIAVLTLHPDSYKSGNPVKQFELIENLKNAGIYVTLKTKYFEKYTVIDNELVWYGNMNFLAKTYEEESVMRVRSSEIASELTSISFAENDY